MLPLIVTNLGLTQFPVVWNLQKTIWDLRHASRIPDVLLLTEHHHVYTIGKSGNDNHLLASDKELARDGAEVYHIDRGGDITYHGPGQVVGYPVIDLNNYFLDVHRYLRSLEETMILTLAEFGIQGRTEEGMTGVWVKQEKIAAIGVKLSRWVTMHGFALNVNTDLRRFERIIPCGIFHKGVTSMKKVLEREISVEDVESSLACSFAKVFGCEATHESYLELQSRIMDLKSVAA